MFWLESSGRARAKDSHMGVLPNSGWPATIKCSQSPQAAAKLSTSLLVPIERGSQTTTPGPLAMGLNSSTDVPWTIVIILRDSIGTTCCTRSPHRDIRSDSSDTDADESAACAARAALFRLFRADFSAWHPVMTRVAAAKIPAANASLPRNFTL